LRGVAGEIEFAEGSKCRASRRFRSGVREKKEEQIRKERGVKGGAETPALETREDRKP